MHKKGKWINLSLIGLSVVGLSGFVMRCKIVFSMPFINYNHLLEAHSHFTFGGWVTMGLLTLMVYDLLPVALHQKKVYQWLLGGLAISAWGMFVAYLLEGYSTASIICSFIFILMTILFTVNFLRDARNSKLPKVSLLLASAALICLLLSAAGTIIIAYIYFTNSFDAFLYRDSLFTYLHFQYNGFFTLAIFSLLSNFLYKSLDAPATKKLNRFSLILCISILPSLFISYLWQDPKTIFWMIAIGGSLLLLLCCGLFVLFAKSVRPIFYKEKPAIRMLIAISMGSFLLKTFLQCFTIFPVIGNAIFGNRPVIMGFLHLVFLAFSSLFIIAFITREGLLDGNRQITKAALLVFATAILLNEAVLITQGLATMLVAGSIFFPWALWVIGFCLFIGTILIGIARIKTAKQKKELI